MMTITWQCLHFVSNWYRLSGTWEKINQNLKTSPDKHYLDPWCKNPKNSRTFDDTSKYLPEPAPPCTKITIFSINLYAARITAAPCSSRRGEKRTGGDIFLALGGVPWHHSLMCNTDTTWTFVKTTKERPFSTIIIIPLSAWKAWFENQ